MGSQTKRKLNASPKLASTRESTQVCKTGTCVWTCNGRSNEFTYASRNVVNLTHIHLTCHQLVSTCIGWPNIEKRAQKFELDQSQRKWVAKRNASCTQVENLRWFAGPFGPFQRRRMEFNANDLKRWTTSTQLLDRKNPRISQQL